MSLSAVLIVVVPDHTHLRFLTYLLTAAIVSSASSSGYDKRSFESENRK